MSPAHDDTRDRVIRLEAELRALTKSVDGMAEKVGEVHETLMKARGARWGFYAAAGVFGVIGSKIAQYLPGFGNG